MIQMTVELPFLPACLPAQDLVKKTCLSQAQNNPGSLPAWYSGSQPMGHDSFGISQGLPKTICISDICILQIIAIAKLQFWSSNKSNFMVLDCGKQEIATEELKSSNLLRFQNYDHGSAIPQLQ